MIVGGILLILLGWFLGISALVFVGVILAVLGAFLYATHFGGRRYY